MTSPETVLRDNDTTSGTDLYLSFELGDKRWTLTLSDGSSRPEPVHGERRRAGRGGGMH